MRGPSFFATLLERSRDLEPARVVAVLIVVTAAFLSVALDAGQRDIFRVIRATVMPWDNVFHGNPRGRVSAERNDQLGLAEDTATHPQVLSADLFSAEGDIGLDDRQDKANSLPVAHKKSL